MARPAKYKNAEELQKAIDVYFRLQEMKNESFTITELASSLGFNSRQSFYNHEKKPEYASTILKAKEKIFANWQE